MALEKSQLYSSSQKTIDTNGAFAFGTFNKTELTLANGHGAQDEVQTVTLSNATGGTFRLTYKAEQHRFGEL